MPIIDPNDPRIQEIRQRMVPWTKIVGLPQYPDNNIQKGQRYAVALPRWISGDCGEQMYDICVATEDIPAQNRVKFTPYVSNLMTSDAEPDKPLHDYTVDYWNKFANEWQSIHVRAHSKAEAKAMVWCQCIRTTDRVISKEEAEDIKVNDYSDTVLTPAEFKEHELDSTIDRIRTWEEYDEEDTDE